MTNLKSFRGMNKNERVSALEAVIAGDLRLFILLPETDVFVMPTEVWNKYGFCDVEYEEVSNYKWKGGVLEFQHGKRVAINVLGNVFEIDPSLLDKSGDAIWLASVRSNKRVVTPFLDESGKPMELETRVGSQECYVCPATIKLEEDMLAVAPATIPETPVDRNKDSRRETTKTDPIRRLMVSYLDKTKGKGDFNGCWRYLLEDSEVDEKRGRLLYTSYSGEHQKPLRKSVQNRFRDCKKQWQQEH